MDSERFINTYLRNYRLDDESGVSVYENIRRNNNFTDEEIYDILSLPLIWNIEEDGYVHILFESGGAYVEKDYLTEDISTGFKLLGAIYTYYNKDLTEELAREIARSDIYDFYYDGIIRQMTEGARKLRDLDTIGPELNNISYNEIHKGYLLRISFRIN